MPMSGYFSILSSRISSRIQTRLVGHNLSAGRFVFIVRFLEERESTPKTAEF